MREVETREVEHMQEKIDFEKENKDYPFLSVAKPEEREHYEVTQYSLNMVYEKYRYYKDNYNEPMQRDKCMPQMITSPGWSISNKTLHYDTDRQLPSINVSCDVLTGCKAFSKETDIGTFKEIYHTIGNFIPIPEGANFRPGAQGCNGNRDHYEFKLGYIRNLFYSENIISDEDYQISKRIEIGFPLGNARQTKIEEKNEELKKELEPFEPLKPLKGNVQLRYWIQHEWKDKYKMWPDFVTENFLQDFVDINFEPLKFNSKDSLSVCKKIICRGYRITHNGELDLKIINEICKQLK